MLFENQSQQTLSNFAIKFNQNYLGLTPAAPIKVSPIGSGSSGTFSLPLKDSTNEKEMGGSNYVVQMAIKSDLGVAYFQDTVDAFYLFDDSGRLEKKAFLALWSSIPDSNEVKLEVANRLYSDAAAIQGRLCGANLFYVATRNVKDRGEVIYFSLSFKALSMLGEITLGASNSCVAVIKSQDPTLSQLALNGVVALLTS